jgi:hypothetical protein
MRRSGASVAFLLALCLSSGCSSPSVPSGDPSAPVLPPPDSVVLELDGKAFQAGCANAQPGGSFQSGATCGTAGTGAGPTFHSLDCRQLLDQDPPIYFVGALFHGFDRNATVGDVTFDLSDPGHEDHVTVMMNYMDETRTEYEYCTAPPVGSDPALYPASSGTVTIHQLAPDPGAPPGDDISDVELTNVVVPSFNGGPALTILAAHLYFQ